MQVASLLGTHVPTHGLRKGRGMSELSTVSLTLRTRRADYQMNRVQNWAKRHLITLRGCELKRLTPLDKMDDRLADVLRVLSDDER
jgi:hypothetical protein